MWIQSIVVCCKLIEPCSVRRRLCCTLILRVVFPRCFSPQMLFVGVFVATFSISLVDIAWSVLTLAPQSSPLGYVDLFFVIGSVLRNSLASLSS